MNILLNFILFSRSLGLETTSNIKNSTKSTVMTLSSSQCTKTSSSTTVPTTIYQNTSSPPSSETTVNEDSVLREIVSVQNKMDKINTVNIVELPVPSRPVWSLTSPLPLLYPSPKSPIPVPTLPLPFWPP